MDKRLTAYAFLKDSYDKANGVTTHAFRDMFETVLVKQSGKQFDSDQFSKDMTEIYGVHIPTRAIHGLLVHMREMGLVNFEDKKGSVAHVSVIDDDKYKRDDPLIETIVEELEDFCDELGCDKFEVDVRFFEWVRSLAFLEESNGKTEKKDSVFFSLFVENVKKRSEFKYSRLKDVMCGCLMAEAIETLSYKQDDGKFKGVDFYFDAPMLLDMFDLNSRDSTAYVREIVDSIKKFGGRVSTFEHCVVEAEKVLTAVLYAYRDNPALVSFDIGLRIKENSAHVSRVVSISGNLRKMLVDAGIFIVDAEARESQDK